MRKPFALEVNAQDLVQDGADPGDAEHAERIMKAAHQLQAAMDGAARAGLILEPNFTRFENKSAEYGHVSDSYLCKIEIYRKLV